jgi:hypothetical protein
VFERSPYGHAAEELIALVFAELLGYVGIRQDMRGTGVSLARTAPCSCAHKTRAPLRPTLNAPTRTTPKHHQMSEGGFGIWHDSVNVR